MLPYKLVGCAPLANEEDIKTAVETVQRMVSVGSDQNFIVNKLAVRENWIIDNDGNPVYKNSVKVMVDSLEKE